MAGSAPILVTAFEPFGPIRGHIPGLRGNRSEGVLEQLRTEYHGSANLAFEVLPVSGSGCDLLEARLSQGPAGVLLMGEALLAGLRLELRARDPKSQIGPIPLPGAQWRTSPFAESIAEEMKSRGVSTATGIGTYYCNRAYWLAQEWAERMGNRPTVFFHMGLLASLQWQCGVIQEALARMVRSTPAS
ncbi:MAG TPA: hypothetical protein VGK94_02440 [Candidatus Polarisedimenticolia bacterium]|jgi:pyrrolidone-carboxylate peptidase